ncbi:hypothetical protein HZS_384 [Henneguya salminicola]|nr:hypothetical protein HZS_384 [Henneguya salminicola]
MLIIKKCVRNVDLNKGPLLNLKATEKAKMIPLNFTHEFYKDLFRQINCNFPTRIFFVEK